MHAKNTHTIYAVKIVNKRPRNGLKVGRRDLKMF